MVFLFFIDIFLFHFYFFYFKNIYVHVSSQYHATC